VEGFGIKESNDTLSPEPAIDKPPISLDDFEIVAVVAFLQAMDTPENGSKVTALHDWENYFGKKLTRRLPLVGLRPVPTEEDRLRKKLDEVVRPGDSPEDIVEKMACFACHKIPGMSNAQTGTLGPVLAMQDIAKERIQSAAYQQAVKAGRAHARTPKEYVIESIVDPSAFIVPGYVDGMVPDYGHQFTVTALDALADFLLS